MTVYKKFNFKIETTRRIFKKYSDGLVYVSYKNYYRYY